MAATARPAKPAKKTAAKTVMNVPIPKQPRNRVEDTVGYMTSAARSALDARLRQWHADTGYELGVYIGTTTGKTPRAHWSLIAFNSWGMGKKGEDKGIVLFIFADEGRPGRGGWQIIVGFGVEKFITDQEATQIVREVPVPGLDAGNCDQAVNDVVNAIIAEIK